MTHFAVTGATGFVGSGMLRRMARVSASDSNGTHPGEALLGLCRRAPSLALPGVRYVLLGDLGALDKSTEPMGWAAALQGVDVVIHTAARVHVMTETTADPLTAFRRVNVEGTLNLARQAAAVGVRRFVFVSSIKVNGEATQLGRPFTAEDAPAPLDAYGVSKMEAEQGLRELAAETGIEVVIIRPSLVYGPGVKANFAAMMRWLNRGVPLPLGAIHNQRSLVALDNLVDLIVTCLSHPAAANQTFLVSDDEDVSTTELLRRMGRAMGCPARLVPVPASWLQVAATLLGKQDMAQRLCLSLQVDIAKTRDLLGWRPPLSLDQGLKKAAEGYGRETVV